MRRTKIIIRYLRFPRKSRRMRGVRMFLVLSVGLVCAFNLMKYKFLMLSERGGGEMCAVLSKSAERRLPSTHHYNAPRDKCSTISRTLTGGWMALAAPFAFASFISSSKNTKRTNTQNHHDLMLHFTPPSTGTLCYAWLKLISLF